MRKRAALILLAAVGAGGIVALAWPRGGEPECQGKKLSKWLDVYGSPANAQDKMLATEAVRQIGTNAVPLLLKWTDYEPAPWRGMLATAVRKLPRALGGSDWLQKFIIGGGEAHCRQGMIGFHILGATASGAVPELSERLRTRTSPSGGLCAYALGEIGKEGLPPLVEALTNIQALNRVDAVAAIGLYIAPTNGVNLVPVLARCFNDKDPVVAALSVRALGRLGIELDSAVPPLTNALKDLRPHVRVVAIQTVGDLGSRGRSAVPQLVHLLTDSDSGVRREATNTLQKVAPEALAKEKL